MITRNRPPRRKLATGTAGPAETDGLLEDPLVDALDPGPGVAQALISVGNFQTATTTRRFGLSWGLERPRASIAAVDTALGNVHAALPIDRRARLEDLLRAINTYLGGKTDDVDNPRLRPVLALQDEVLGELRNNGRAVALANTADWAGHDALVAAETDLGQLKILVAQRFGLDPANIGALPVGQRTAGGAAVQNARDWTVAGLKRAYDVLKGLPATHTEANTAFAHFLRYEQLGGGWFRDSENKVAIGTPANDQHLGATHGATGDQRAGKRAIDWTIRHEIGHAVFKGNVAASTYTGAANGLGGGWNTDEVEVVREVLVGAGGIMSTILAAVSVPTQTQILQLVAGMGAPIDQFHANLIANRNNNDGNAPPQVTWQNVMLDPAWALLGGNLDDTWQNGTLHQLGGRCFVRSNDRGLASFDPAAFGRKVSNYQFRSESEWFAEAYSAYFEPSGAPGALLTAAGDLNTGALISTL